MLVMKDRKHITKEDNFRVIIVFQYKFCTMIVESFKIAIKLNSYKNETRGEGVKPTDNW